MSAEDVLFQAGVTEDWDFFQGQGLAVKQRLAEIPNLKRFDRVYIEMETDPLNDGQIQALQNHRTDTYAVETVNLLGVREGSDNDGLSTFTKWIIGITIVVGVVIGAIALGVPATVVVVGVLVVAAAAFIYGAVTSIETTAGSVQTITESVGGQVAVAAGTVSILLLLLIVGFVILQRRFA